MNQKSTNRFVDMARCYHEMAPYVVPMYDWMQDAVLTHLEMAGLGESIQVLDLGGGSGRMARKFLERFPESQVVIVDNSPTFLEISKGGRVIWIFRWRRTGSRRWDLRPM